ncbi:MAG: HlyD family efflux transporter periplasmic adaptor subunit [Chloroflexi bacterium]|nr:HlyD family efflux transporter periplasmic adaptor subunit [Chloroflexota bacterium]
MQRFLSSLLILLILFLILAGAALWLIPDQAEQTWRAAGLSPEPLDQAMIWLGNAPAREDEVIRLWGVFEVREHYAMSEIPGRAARVLAEEGDRVEKGQPLVELETQTIEADIHTAEEAVHAAQAAREAAAAPPDETVIALAESAVAAAETRLENAQRSLEQARSELENPLELDAQINEIAASIPAAEAAVGRAEANLKQVEVMLEEARRDMSREGQYQQRILEKQKAAAEAELEAARVRVQGLRRTLALLKAVRENPIALQASVNAAEYEVTLAQAALDVAKAQRAVATEPPSRQTVAVADAGVKKAQAALALARWPLKRATILAPADGRVLMRAIEPGETVTPGQALITIADTTQLDLRAYVAQQDLHRVQVGDRLRIETPAANEPVFGTVYFIADEAQFRPTNVLDPQERGEIVFLIKLRAPNEAGILKPGMPAEVVLP